MESIALILIIISILLLAIIVGLLTFLILKLLKKSETPNIADSQFHPGILKRMKEIENLKPKRSDLFCPNHPEEPGETTCVICDKLFCKACIKPFKNLHLCKEHFPLMMKHEWEEILTIKTSTTDPEQGVQLYEAKKEVFERDELPTYIETHYKINVDQDYIETYLVLFGIKEKILDLREKFKLFT